VNKKRKKEKERNQFLRGAVAAAATFYCNGLFRNHYMASLHYAFFFLFFLNLLCVFKL